jgi:hypothetical protein
MNREQITCTHVVCVLVWNNPCRKLIGAGRSSSSIHYGDKAKPEVTLHQHSMAYKETYRCEYIYENSTLFVIRYLMVFVLMFFLEIC